jgi:hypothetical protein
MPLDMNSVFWGCNILSLGSVESEGGRIYGIPDNGREEAASDRPSAGSEKSREGEGQRVKSLREGSPKAAALRHVSAANTGTSPIGGEDLIRERRSGLPASVTDVSDRSVNKVIRVPIHFVVDAKKSGEYAFCRWNEGEIRYRYTPASEKRLLTESECRKAPSVLKAVEYKVASPSIVREMKRLGSVEISKERMRCRFDLYADRYDRYRIGLISPGSGEVCGILLPQKEAVQ